MTVKAIRTIEKCDVIALPDSGSGRIVSYDIASATVPDIDKKEILRLKTPMTKGRAKLSEAYRRAALEIAALLDTGRSVAYLTIGDPCVYSTYIYIHRLIAGMGYSAEIVSGVPSFCAASAALSDSIADRAEQIHIIPSSYDIDSVLSYPGTKVLMKSGAELNSVLEKLRNRGCAVSLVQNCGLENEKIFRDTDEISVNPEYLTIIFVRDSKSR